MSGPAQRVVPVRGEAVRVWEKGEGEPLAVLAGLYGYTRWTPFLDELSKRRRVIVPSLPGLPGGGDFRHLDDLADWVVATLDLAEAAGIEGSDWIGLGPGATLAAEAEAFSRGSARRLALVAPFGLFDSGDPILDFWARRSSEVAATFSTKPEDFAAEALECPDGEDPLEWTIQTTRALEASARLLWPLGDRGLGKRLHRLRCETLLVWGEQDAVVPPTYAERFAAAISGPTKVGMVPGAGHRADFDAPERVASTVLDFFG